MPDEENNCDVSIKSAVVIQLLSKERTAEELAITYSLDADQILRWKKQVIDQLPAILATRENRLYSTKGIERNRITDDGR